ncbi:hypothetical protein D8Y22_09495 [Salinadaptatus halalkaliphilus]|uniref:CARDB domain-containing protein n=1 Tax=Salinadaptatus halalkaliphilus TaxID=2419781 RepID=A0A4S3TQ74_9EURY|nr:hypothetical protein [Salinadaptatus halalkaliphilus]THE65403.1 hypothetical protein D8Y22_09495 [Salinadaptatus halalkaliphilus]
MDDPTRRRLLWGAATGSVVLASIDGTAANRRRGVASSGTATDALEVSIIETDAPVPAGEYLRITTELENTGSTDVRIGMELLVGHAEASIGRRELTVEAGESRTVRQGFYTYPVPSDDEFPIRVETDAGSAERMVSVTGASTLPDSSPDAELTVAPGTEVFFEAGAIDPDAFQQAIWWVDGTRAGGGVGGPWESTYYGETGAHYWRQTFDEVGTYEVAAAVVPDDGEQTYAATWTVEVDPGGHGPPSIDDRRPSADVLSVSRGETYEVELTASDPDGGLDRVVWWLTQADTILEITDLEGTTDTATLSTDAFCHTCHVMPWVICSDGRIATLEGWQLEEDRGTQNGVSVSIRSTNSPVEAGDLLEVIVDVENSGQTPITQDLELVVGHDPELVDTQEITLDAGESGAATLEFETYPVAQDQRFPVRVVGEDDEAEITVVAEAEATTED